MKQNISERTLKDLEFQTILKKIAEYCISDLGREVVPRLQPIPNSIQLKEELYQVNEYLASFENENRIPPHYFDAINDELHLLGIEDSFLEATAFLKIINIAKTIKELIAFLKKFKEYYPQLHRQSEPIIIHQEIISNIDAVVSKHGEVLDKASPILKNIRKDINLVRGKIGASFTSALSRYASAGYLDEIRESVIDHQRVLAVQAMYRKKVKGSILGNSKTGSIVYIAPESTLQYHRELQNLQYEEQEEVVKILKTLTNQLRPFKTTLKQYQTYLTHLDTIGARAKYAQHIKACLPKISKTQKIYLKNAYHPILWEENQSKQRDTIPQTLELNKTQQIIVISGPNAGGKSITLKTVGLLQVMLQSGILIPVHEKSEVSIFNNILSDIGDNQSIENQLSTYSYRLKNMRYFLQKCNENTLFLIDEFGTGSDPELGGALAEIFLEEFYEKGAYGIITTHYANLKVLASELENVTNANMQFDSQSLNPKFKLHIGQAGSSFTFEVAKKNGIPYRLINRAKKKVEREKIRLDKTIAKLQTERHALQKAMDDLKLEKNIAEKKSNELLKKNDTIKHKIDSFQELYDNNQKMLSYGRKFNELLHKYFQTNNKKQLNEELKKWVTIEKSKHDQLKKDKISKTTSGSNSTPNKPISKRERKIINQELRKIQKQKEEKLKAAEKEILKEVVKVREVKQEKAKKEALTKANYTFKINDKVRLIDSKSKGTIEKIEKNTATINYGIFTAKSSLDQLELVKSAK